MIYRFLIFLLICSFIISCKSPEARKPVKVISGSYINASVEKNKKWISEENAFLKDIIEKDTINKYHISEKGFWYYYNIALPHETEQADFGDIIEYEYSITDINGEIIYSKEELGSQTYQMDKEELFTGLREGLKIMKEGETVTFVFPSYTAFGYYGDSKKIGTNMPIVSTVTVLNIEQIN